MEVNGHRQRRSGRCCLQLACLPETEFRARFAPCMKNATGWSARRPGLLVRRPDGSSSSEPARTRTHGAFLLHRPRRPSVSGTHAGIPARGGRVPLLRLLRRSRHRRPRPRGRRHSIRRPGERAQVVRMPRHPRRGDDGHRQRRLALPDDTGIAGAVATKEPGSSGDACSVSLGQRPRTFPEAIETDRLFPNFMQKTEIGLSDRTFTPPTAARRRRYTATLSAAAGAAPSPPTSISDGLARVVQRVQAQVRFRFDVA